MLKRLFNTHAFSMAARRGLFLFVALAGVALFASAATVVLNPYADVDWEAVGQHKANLHTHTTQSDGHMTPTQVIDEYRSRGYSILALTDHNLCTWPWTGLADMERKGRAFQGDRTAERAAERGAEEEEEEEEDEERGSRRLARVQPVPAYEDRDPAALGMIAVVGNEPSLHHHMGAYFIEYETRSRELEQTLQEVGEAGGIAMLFHPGRYWKPEEDGSIPDEVVEQYVTLYNTFDHLFGMEVINQGKRYKQDVELWDKVLAVTMPDRPVWGHANDDMHTLPALGRDWSMFLLDNFDEADLRAAMLSGRGYFSSISTHDRDDRDVSETPVIRSITHDEAAGAITIRAESGGVPLPDDQVKWISMGAVVHVGPVLNYKTAEGLGNYVRAELTGKGGTTYTNPFGLQAD